VYQGASVFRSRLWLPPEDWDNDGIGEQTELCCEKRYLDWVSGSPPVPNIVGPIPCGSPAVFKDGGGPDDPLFMTNADGTANCCRHPCFTPDLTICLAFSRIDGYYYSVMSGWWWWLTALSVGAAPCVYEDYQYTFSDNATQNDRYRMRITIQPGRGADLILTYRGTGPNVAHYICPDVTAVPAIWTIVDALPTTAQWPSAITSTFGPCPPPRMCPDMTQFHVTYPHIFGPRCVTLNRLDLAPQYNRFTALDGVSAAGWSLSDSTVGFHKALSIHASGSGDAALYHFDGGCGSGTATLAFSGGVRPWDSEPWPATLAVGTGPCP